MKRQYDNKWVMSERIWGFHSFIQQTFFGYLSCAVNF